ncbi:MAG: trypsin-like peptidase domain-containing protein, partial [Myxococcaceae bacterium]
LVNPPAGLVAVKVSRKDPMPGEAVSALGNGGIGLLWAIKDGEIASMGRLSTHLAQIAGAECQVSADPTAAAACNRSMRELDSVKRTMDEKIPGLVIQSSCPISPGDSGGPLVNRAGELVGLNAFLRADRSAPVSANFHVHVAEIRKFLAEVPQTPARLVPDPWKSAGTMGVLADADLDGKIDTLSFGNLGKAVTFLDLDESSLYPGAPLPTAAELASTRRFDAEVAVLRTDSEVLVWYDSDDDGRFDRLYSGAPRPGGRVQAGYSLGADGVPTRLPEETDLVLFAKENVAAAEQGLRLERVAQATFPSWVNAPAAETSMTVLPDPLWGAGRSGVPYDTDRDGKLDSIWMLSPFAAGLVVDADQDVLGTLKATEVGKALGRREVGAELALIVQGKKMWCFLDTDHDGKFDLVLYTPNSASGAASEAYHLVDGKQGPAAPGYVGRKLIRPELLGAPDAAIRLRAAVRRYYPWHLVAADDGALSSLPAPLETGRDIGFEDAALPGWEDAVVSVLGESASAVLIDLDRDTFKAKKNQSDVARVVAAGKFKAEFAWVGRGGMEWAYYDTDRDGRYDLVLFTARPGPGASEAAFRIDRKGKLIVDALAAQGKMLRPSLFKKDQRGTFRTLAETFFRPEQLGE